ncbi:preprotein translocase subunit YajC [Micrococcales bacterium KH10]|nr:preprotein translocase subunit YajC [Micrococcales bacterium KH10]
MDPIFLILIFFAVAMVWMSSRQRKAQQKTQAFVESLTPGAKVMTMSGYIGTIVDITDEHVTLESVPGGGTTVWIKPAIRQSVVDPVIDASDEANPVEASSDEVEIPDNIAKLIGEDTSSIDKYTKSNDDEDRGSDTSK